MNPDRIRQQKRAVLYRGGGAVPHPGGRWFLPPPPSWGSTGSGRHLHGSWPSTAKLHPGGGAHHPSSAGSSSSPSGGSSSGCSCSRDLLVILLIPVPYRNARTWWGGRVARGLGKGPLLLMALAWVPPPLRVLPEFLPETGAGTRSSSFLVVLSLPVRVPLPGRTGLGGAPLVAGAFVAGWALFLLPGERAPPRWSGGSGLHRRLLHGHLLHRPWGAALGIPTLGELVAGRWSWRLVVLVLTPSPVAWIAERTGFSARPAILAGLIHLPDQ